jgi:small-conductance mechanosensitive channel
VRRLERTISWLVWGVWVLWAIGLLPVLLEEADGIRWKVGSSTLTLRNLIEGGLNVAVALLLALWLSSALEARLLRAAGGAALSLRKMVANALRAVLVFVAVLLALSAVGIDLTTLSVLGGAIGVGIGLGLKAGGQLRVGLRGAGRARCASATRCASMASRGASPTSARYTVIRSGSGSESVVPNEMLVTQRVENLSWPTGACGSPRWSAWSTAATSIWCSACCARRRCPASALREPAPFVGLSAFGADALEFTVGYWMNEPESGSLGLRSEVNLAILQALRANGIDIPFPQRVVQAVPAARP